MQCSCSLLPGLGRSSCGSPPPSLPHPHFPKPFLGPNMHTRPAPPPPTGPSGGTFSLYSLLCRTIGISPHATLLEAEQRMLLRMRTPPPGARPRGGPTPTPTAATPRRPWWSAVLPAPGSAVRKWVVGSSTEDGKARTAASRTAAPRTAASRTAASRTAASRTAASGGSAANRYLRGLRTLRALCPMPTLRVCGWRGTHVHPTQPHLTMEVGIAWCSCIRAPA